MKVKVDGKEFEISEQEFKKLICKNGSCSVAHETDGMRGSSEEDIEDLQYVLIRSKDAGVFAGYLFRDDENGRVELYQARRIWYWSGAASLSEIAIRGCKNPSQCKVPEPVPNIAILDVCEIIECSDVAKQNLQSIPAWKAD